MLTKLENSIARFLRAGRRVCQPNPAKWQKPRQLSLESLEDRRMLATIVPQQTNPATTGGIDFLWIRGDSFGRTNTTTLSDITNARDAMADYYLQNSSGNAFVDTFDITPVLDINQSINSIGELANAYRAAAANAGYNLANYTRFIYNHPNVPSTVSFGGGALGAGSGSGGQAWIPEGVFSSSTASANQGVTHESIHTLGLGHSIDLNAGNQIYSTTATATAGIDPYHFMGSEGTARLNADITAYFKYWIGWIDASNVTVAPDEPSGVYRIYKNANPNIASGQKVALQIGEGSSAVWLSYVPDVPNAALKTHGVVAHLVGGQTNRLLDLTPNSDQPGEGDEVRQTLTDLWDAAAVVGQTSAIPVLDFEFTPIAEGGTGDNKWVDIEVKKAEVAVVDLNKSEYHYDFGPEGSPVESGFTRITPLTAGDIDWLQDVAAVDRGLFAGTNNNRDFITGTTATTLEHKVRNGTYRVTLRMGDSGAARDNMQVHAEGNLISSDIDSPAGQFSYVNQSGASASFVSFDVTVLDGSLTLEFADNGGNDPEWVVNQLSIEQLGVVVDTSQDEYHYDFGPAGSVVEQAYPGYQLISPSTNGDIHWSGSVEGVGGQPSFTVGGVTTLLGVLGNGIAADDSATGSGYLMYSEENVFTRFAANGVEAGNSEHLIAVRILGNQWQYSNNLNNGWFNFAPRSSDRLLASVNFGADTIASLKGQTGQIAGINLGYESDSGLVFLADSWNGSPNDGEFQILGPSGNAGDLFGDLIQSTETRTLEHKIENGIWRVTLVMGDPQTTYNDMRVSAEGVLVSGNIDTAAGEFAYVTTGGASLTPASFDVTVSDGSLTLKFTNSSIFSEQWVANQLSLERVGLVVDTSSTEYHYDFGTVDSFVEPGFTRITPSMTAGDVAFNGSTDSRDRYTPTVSNDEQGFNRDFVFSSSDRTLEHKIANGTWRVTMTMGDLLNTNLNMGVRAEGVTISADIDAPRDINAEPILSTFAYVTNAGSSLTPASFEVVVNDGSLTLELLRGSSIWMLNRLSLERIDIPGDFNSDTNVDGLDLTQWQGDYGVNDNSDANNDGQSDGFDFLTWQQNFAPSQANIATVSAAQATIPTAVVTTPPTYEKQLYPNENLDDGGGCPCGGLGCAACLPSVSPVSSAAVANESPAIVNRQPVLEFGELAGVALQSLRKVATGQDVNPREVSVDRFFSDYDIQRFNSVPVNDATLPFGESDQKERRKPQDSDEANQDFEVQKHVNLDGLFRSFSGQ